MNSLIDQELLDYDYRKACFRMAEAILMIAEPSWQHLNDDNKKLFAEQLVASYMKDEYVPRHAKD